MEIHYTDNINELQPEALNGFFTGWPSHPSPETHIEILKRSHKVWLAMDGEKCIGFINALSDGIFYAYIPLLEVLPEYQGKGTGSSLVEKMLESLKDMYAVDIICDKDVSAFYAKKGFFNQCVGMVKRNYHNQSAPIAAKSLANKASETLSDPSTND
jgi:ribosomal protein S18 acetylase RimI-like enzyme